MLFPSGNSNSSDMSKLPEDLVSRIDFIAFLFMFNLAKINNDTNIVLLLHDLSTFFSLKYLTRSLSGCINGRKMKKYKKWKIEELNYIKKNFEKIKDKDLVSLFNKKFGSEITIDMLRRQRRKLGARKTRGRLKQLFL